MSERCCWTCGARLATPDDARRWDFTLPLATPSQNDASASNHGQPWERKKYAKQRGDWQLLLGATMGRLAIPRARGKRRVLITRLYGIRGQAMDPSNLAGGCKLVLDAMVRAGLLVDDAERWIEAHYYQHPANDSGTWIQIVDLEGEDAHGEAEIARATKGRTTVEGGGPAPSRRPRKPSPPRARWAGRRTSLR